MAVRRPIPKQTVFAVDYPGYVANTDNAIQSIGGSKKLARDVNREDRPLVELRYRYKDPVSHSIKGQVVPTENLLIKVTRRIKKPKSGAPGDEPQVKTTTKVIAVIDKTARFRKLSDFQYIVPKDDPLSRISTALRDIDIDCIKELGSGDVFDKALDAKNSYMPAPCIDRHGWPSQFRPRTQEEAEKLIDEQAPNDENGVRDVRKGGFHGISIRFGDQEVPTRPSPESEEYRKLIPPEVLEKAENILLQHPVVSRNAVEVLLPVADCDGIKNNIVMPIFAYLMENGPWRSCWIRLGYDPRKDPESRKYQVLDIRTMFVGTTSGRMRASRRTLGRPHRVDSAPLNVVRAQNITYNEEAARQKVSGIFQFMYIEIQPIKELLEYERGWRATPCEQSGWLQPSLLKCIRSKLRALRLYYDGQRETANGLRVNYEELDKRIDADREDEQAARETRQRIEDRALSLTQGQASQEVRERVDSQVDEFMRMLGTQTGAASGNLADTYASEGEEFEFFEDDEDEESDVE
ncbi:tau 95 subunit of transcription factor TFIIIC [Coemansia sp. RSA 2611]|nr:tau 95 subunit of transcription factor TFIIIC [Coemansia sp. RSA 2704]KAJ2367857.1 tau 95 subunit of transcription factor TFIIIC [Coemansia sp. RSA 2610]KAJ2391237.1 tau 95 subunit of transcription factor TFIIIC [Coemansia sp. RSA 2611]